MATRKATSKGVGKKSAKKTSKKPSPKKAALKKSTTKAAAPAGDCFDWRAQDLKPPRPQRLLVRGKCRFPTHGYRVVLRERVPQGSDPLILLLDKIVTPPTGPVEQAPQNVPTVFRKQGGTRYRVVKIFPEGISIKVTL